MLGDPLRMRGSRVNRRFVARLIIGTSLCGSLAMAGYVAAHRDQWFEKRVKVVVTGKLVRGAWQRPAPLRRIVQREGIKTIVTLTAINSTDSKFPIRLGSFVRQRDSLGDRADARLRATPEQTCASPQTFWPTPPTSPCSFIVSRDTIAPAWRTPPT